VRALVAGLGVGLDWASRLVIALAATALVLLVLITGWMVFTRYVLNDTATWVERGALLAVLWVALPVAAVGIRERFHMAVEVLLFALPPALREGLRIAADIALLALGWVMAVEAWGLSGQMWAFRIPLLGLSQGWQFMPMAICGALVALFAAEHLLRRLVGLPPLAGAQASLD
jgi:TRAP-type C4-dicarboxylate transport system permease small subunit